MSGKSGIFAGALSLCVGIAVAGSAAKADVLTVGGGWDSFFFDGVGSAFSTDFTFTLTSSAVFKVTDAYVDGDQFDITINGVDKGNTSVPTNDGTQVMDDYDAAYASPLYSHAAYDLGPGAYTVTGVTVLSPYGGGGAGAELVAAVPEASTWAMMLLGFAGLGFVARRRAATKRVETLSAA